MSTWKYVHEMDNTLLGNDMAHEIVKGRVFASGLVRARHVRRMQGYGEIAKKSNIGSRSLPSFRVKADGNIGSISKNQPRVCLQSNAPADCFRADSNKHGSVGLHS